MDKKSKETIKEVIEDLLKFRKREIRAIEFSRDPFQYNCDMEEYERERKKRARDRVNEEYDIPLVKLNHLLIKEEQFNEVLEIEKQMTKLQSKKYITVKEFTEIYGYSSDWQKNRRGRQRDKLPFHQEQRGGKIIYTVKEIEQWFENNNLRN